MLFLIFAIAVAQFFCPLFAMENPDASVALNLVTQSQAADMPNRMPAIISVFGVTPRYSAFMDYHRALCQDSDALMAEFNKPKRPKGIARSVVSVIRSLAATPGFDAFAHYIKQEPNAELFRLFFANGYRQDTLKENFAILLKTAQKVAGDGKPCALAHVLMPSYFADLHTLGEKKPNSAQLQLFLQETAQFYRTLYQEIIKDDGAVKVQIIVPELADFERIMDQGEQVDKLEANMDVLLKKLIKPLGVEHTYVLLNQDTQELTPMITYLSSKDIPHVKGAAVPISNQRGFPSTIFNTYLLKPGAKRDFKTSPLITQQLLEHVQAHRQEATNGKQ